MAPQNPFPNGVLVLLEAKVLAALQSLIRQQLSQHDFHLPFEEPYILLTITLLSHVKHLSGIFSVFDGA